MLKKYPKEVKQYAEEIKFCETQIEYFESKKLAAEEAMNAIAEQHHQILVDSGYITE